MDNIAVRSIEDIRELLAVHHQAPPLRLGEILVAENLIDEEHLIEALHRQTKEHGKRKHLGQILVEMRLISSDKVNIVLARKLGIPYVKLRNFEVPARMLSRLPPDIALQYNVVPLGEIAGKLVVAMENPLDDTVANIIRFNTRLPIEAVMAPPGDIGLLVHRHYSKLDEHEALEDLQIAAAAPRAPAAAAHVLEQEAQRKPIVRLLNSILAQGVSRGASDINIRPAKDCVHVYYRIDGRLHHARTIHKSLSPPLVSRIKITGQIDIAERRLPQDGHARLLWENRNIDLRISVIPTVNGESVVIRILDKETGLRPLHKLGFMDRELQQLEHLIARPHGMFLVTGPTGSGKTTTLYAILNEVRKRAVHILTVEDPVEYDMDGIEQVQISVMRGYTFAQTLRHFLRHDPDVIMVGEVRDEETAHIVNKAALTGHLVFSTLHTNSAAAAVGRLRDMGVESYLLSSTLLGVMAQRLVRVNCPHCRGVDEIHPPVRKAMKLGATEKFYRGKGCDSCNNVGYHGRMTVCELLRITPEIVDLINTGAPAQKIAATAIGQGMRTIMENALALAREGVTSIEEVYALSIEF